MDKGSSAPLWCVLGVWVMISAETDGTPTGLAYTLAFFGTYALLLGLESIRTEARNGR